VFSIYAKVFWPLLKELGLNPLLSEAVFSMN